MGPFGMDRTPAAFKCQNDKMKMKQFTMEPNNHNMVVDSFLGLGIENMEDFSHGFDFSFLPDYGGLYFCTSQDGEAGLELQILDGFLDEVEDIYVSQDLSSASLEETEVKKSVSELDGDPCGCSKSFSPRISGSIRLSEWSKETVPHVQSQNASKVNDSLDTNLKDMQCLYESEDDKKPISTFIGSWVGQKKNLCNTGCSRLDSFGGEMSYDFRPRKGPFIHATTENNDQLTSPESEDEIAVTNRCKSKSDRRKHQRMWTVDEVVKLVDGIAHFGVGKWTDIKNLFFHSVSHRTPIDIRDKWRNLLKASYADKHKDGEAEKTMRPVARPIPKDILHRVRELALFHPHPLYKSLRLVHDSPRSRSTSKRKKKRS